ncbi:MAG TPA: STAS domain-containing protein [Solirubrobacteraceae bacterium]|nr:STAS domain-containing protein [Solirubrobacteraceae bacterium]
METDFEVGVKAEAQGTVVTVSGELDVASSQALEHELAKLHGVPTVIVDLRALTFIDSTGLGVLVRTHQACKEQGRRLGLVRGNGQVNRLLNLTGLDDELLVVDSPEDLLAGQ